MKFNLKNRPKILTPEDHHSGGYNWVNPQKSATWFIKFEEELREHYDQYKKLVKPPDEDEVWYALQYLELLIEEILGEVQSSSLKEG